MATQLRVFDEDELPIIFHLQNWKNRGRELRGMQGDTNWEIGDWLILGKEKGKLPDEDLKKHAVSVTKHPWGMLKNLMSVARRFPRLRRREAPLTYSHHVEVAKFDEKTQDRLLDAAVTIGVKPGTAWSRTELVQHIKAEQQAGRLPPTGKQKIKEAMHLLKIRIPIQDYNRLRDLAKFKLGKSNAGDLVWWMATQYWKQNKDSLHTKDVSPHHKISS